MVMDDNAEIVHSMYKELIHKYLIVCHKQFLKDTKDRLNIMNKKPTESNLIRNQKREDSCWSYHSGYSYRHI